MRAAQSEGRAWSDRVVVVTGGTSGIGREFAMRLAAEGASVIVCARNETALGELRTRCPGIDVHRCDVSARPDVLALEEAIRNRHGRIDVLINNAGIMEQVDLLDGSISDERITHEIAVNLTGPILLTRTLLPLLRAGREPDDRDDHLGVRVASGDPRADLFRDQGRTPLLYHGAAAAVARGWHSSRRSDAAAGRYTGHALRSATEDVA